jgi:ribonuclease HI
MTLARTVADVMRLEGGVVVGTDGSCVSNPGPTGWAYVADDGTSACGGLVQGTNNIGELLAVENALRDFADRPLVIQADSAYTIGCSTTWASGWARNGWRNSKKEIVANVEIVQTIYALMRARRDTDAPVFFQKVKAHLIDLSVWPLNVAADRLAGEASARAARGDVSELRTTGRLLSGTDG